MMCTILLFDIIFIKKKPTFILIVNHFTGKNSISFVLFCFSVSFLHLGLIAPGVGMVAPGGMGIMIPGPMNHMLPMMPPRFR